jgi:hypothetical protein
MGITARRQPIETKNTRSRSSKSSDKVARAAAARFLNSANREASRVRGQSLASDLAAAAIPVRGWLLTKLGTCMGPRLRRLWNRLFAELRRRLRVETFDKQLVKQCYITSWAAPTDLIQSQA